MAACPLLPEPALSGCIVFSQTTRVLPILNFALHAAMIIYSSATFNARVLCFAGRFIIIQDFRRELFTTQVAQLAHTHTVLSVDVIHTYTRAHLTHLSGSLSTFSQAASPASAAAWAAACSR